MLWVLDGSKRAVTFSHAKWPVACRQGIGKPMDKSLTRPTTGDAWATIATYAKLPKMRDTVLSIHLIGWGVDEARQHLGRTMLSPCIRGARVSALIRKSRDELEEIALKRIRARPGCRGAAAIVLTLDDDGEWSFEVSDPGSADPETVRSAAIAVGHAMHDEFDLAADM
jgi:hypothetical protein